MSSLDLRSVPSERARYRHGMRTSSTLLVALALLIVGCSSTSETTTTTTTTATTTTTTIPDPESALFIDAEGMCRTLDLMVAGGVPAPQAAAAMLDVDLASATSTERAEYGDLLASSPQTTCPEHRLYAEDVTYWLGF
ncbi:MAG: hypothetical protein R6W83_11785 [Cryobacterium sp.]